ncbi:PREDICTED: cx9C motif-containing protein 4 [Bison bison bison]|uniref:Cx9C motif-containing protein 4 n=1 Tax=Bison bison bison TaxID=43346 RepID=A0A6P3IA79_BISBB|nr:PREDICTED: cx9C motif-containing protein 4 [Bison bison bison]
MSDSSLKKREEGLPVCFSANNYMESKCQAVIEELRKCCARYPKGRSLICSGFEKEEKEKQTLKCTPQ